MIHDMLLVIMKEVKLWINGVMAILLLDFVLLHIVGVIELETRNFM